MIQAAIRRCGPTRGVLLLAVLAAAVAAPVAFADPAGNNESVVPDFVREVPSTNVVGQGLIQFETSVAQLQDGRGTALLRVWSTPTMLRFGMPNNYEIRVASPVYEHVRTFGSVNTGVSDMLVGVKGVVPQNVVKNVTLGALVQAWFPSGSSALKGYGVRPELQLMGQWQVSSTDALGGFGGIRSDIDATKTRYKTAALGGNYAHTWNAKVTSFGELAARSINSVYHGGKNLMADVGSSWTVMPATQISGSIGMGLRQHDTDLTWQIGVSRAFRPSFPTTMSHNQSGSKTNDTPSASTEDGR